MMALGDAYLNKVKVGDYVKWRSIVRDQNYEENIVEYRGLIIKIYKVVNQFTRPVHCAKILENKSGKTYTVLLHKIEKVETN